MKNKIKMWCAVGLMCGFALAVTACGIAGDPEAPEGSTYPKVYPYE